MKAFGTGGVVVTAELSAGLVAIGLWQLREMGAVKLEEYHEKKLGLVSTHGVRVTVLGDAVEVGGVETRLLETLATWKKSRDGGVSAWDVANMVCRNGNGPHGTVIGIALDDAVALGYLDRVPSLEPTAERIASVEPTADELAAQWRDFRQGDEASMAKLLRSTTYDGIEAQARAAARR